MLSQSVISSLESGDHLSRAEFEYRYTHCPHIKKAELINGVVFVASPVRVHHAQSHSQIITWLCTYASHNLGMMVCDNATVRLEGNNDVQPDALLRLEETYGGQSRISEDDYIEGAPGLVVEIASSSASYDLYDKKEIYCRCGVKEYLVWVISEPIFYWYQLTNRTYLQQIASSEGILCSREFPGLWLHLPALLRGNMKQVMETLDAGLNSSEYREFMHRLENLG